MEKDFVCICCPLGCSIHVAENQDGTLNITGNTCPRGAQYVQKELTNPTRIVTSTVRVKDGVLDAVSVKTAGDIPKGKIMDCMKALNQVELTAPVKIGDIVLKNVADTGVDIVATKNIDKA